MSVIEDEIRLAVPAAPAFARLARLTVAGLATRIGFTYDEVEDLRIAVGEACSLLVGTGAHPGAIELVFRVRPASLDITVTGNDAGDPRETADAGLSRQILEAVVDSYDLHAASGPPQQATGVGAVMTECRRARAGRPGGRIRRAPVSLGDDERERLRGLFEVYARTGDRAIRDELIEAHLRLAEHLARRFSNRGEPLDDLVQVASLGLVKAVERFEPDRGLEFSTFATPTIVGELKRHFRDKGWAVRVPRRVQELHGEINSHVGELTQKLGRSPTIAELALASNSSEEEVLEAMEAAHAYRSTSIDAPAPGSEDGGGLAAFLGDDDVRMFEAENRVLITNLLTTLPKREQLMLTLRFYQGMTQSQIAERLGISQMHVSRLLNRSLRMLRERLDEIDNA